MRVLFETVVLYVVIILLGVAGVSLYRDLTKDQTNCTQSLTEASSRAEVAELALSRLAKTKFHAIEAKKQAVKDLNAAVQLK